MTDENYAQYAARLTDPSTKLAGSVSPLRGEAATAAEQSFLVEAYGSEGAGSHAHCAGADLASGRLWAPLRRCEDESCRRNSTRSRRSRSILAGAGVILCARASTSFFRRTSPARNRVNLGCRSGNPERVSG
jgi:hypothetical protein